MRTPVFVALCTAWLIQACDAGPDRTFRLPTAPGATPTPTANPAPPPVPPTRPPLADDFTVITSGEHVSGRVPSDPPTCIGLPGWPCQYFRMTVPANGVLTVELTYREDQQPPGQGVDVSVESPRGEFWADRLMPGAVSARGAVLQGDLLQLVLWYTFPGLEFELTATLNSP